MKTKVRIKGVAPVDGMLAEVDYVEEDVDGPIYTVTLLEERGAWRKGAQVDLDRYEFDVVEE